MERQLEYTFLFLVVGHTTNVPLVSLTLRYNGILACLGCQRYGFVGSNRHTCHELGTFLFTIIQSRIVTQHLKTGFKQYEQSHLVSTGTDTAAVVMVRDVEFRLIVENYTRSIVHRTDCITHERIEHTVVRLAGTVPFHTTHTFVRKHVRILVFQTGRLERSVEVHNQVMLGSFGSYTVVVIHHPLVVTVHEVNLHALHAPFLELGEEVEVLFYTSPSEPQDNAHVLFLSITDKFMQVQVVVWSIRVAGSLRPTFVQQDVFHTVLRSEVHVIFVGSGVASGFEIHILTVWSRTVPPFPSSETRHDPRGIFNLARFSQTGSHGCFDQLTVFLGDDEITPWETTLTVCLGNVIPFLDDFRTTVALFLDFNRVFRESRRHAFLSSRLQEHVRIIRYSRFANKHLATLRSLNQSRKHGKAFLAFPFAVLGMFVQVFVVHAEVVGLLGMNEIITREVHLQEFILHFHFTLPVGDEAISHTVVKSTELYRPVSAELQQQLVVMVADGRELERNDRTEVFVHQLSGTLDHFRIHAQHLLA